MTTETMEARETQPTQLEPLRANTHRCDTVETRANY